MSMPLPDFTPSDLTPSDLTPSDVTLAELTRRAGMDVLDHLELEAAIPVVDGLQAQGDLIVIPFTVVAADVTVAPGGWRPVPAEGVELLRGAAGGNPHTLVADPGACEWNSSVSDKERLALGVFRTTAVAYLLHPEHGGSGVAPGTYVVRRQREGRPGAQRASRFIAD